MQKKERNKIKFSYAYLVNDIIFIGAISILSLMIVCFENWQEMFKFMWPYFIVVTCLTVLLNIVFKSYNILWQYCSLGEILKLFYVELLVVMVCVLLRLTLPGPYPLYTWIIVFGLIEFAYLGFSRTYIRFFVHIKSCVATAKEKSERTKVIIIGAGDAGVSLVKEMKANDALHYHPVCFIDDNTSKIGMSIHNVMVIGNRNSIKYAMDTYKCNRIIIAIPSASSKELRDIIEICQKNKADIQIIPGTVSTLKNRKLLNTIRKVKVEDLLGREPIHIDVNQIMGYIEGKCIIVTGGGGSIGSELCRQIVSHNPKLLIILDIYENNAYNIEQEIKRTHPEVKILALIASVRDEVKINAIFSEYHPDIVFHAAAHKHVPLMETSPKEAIKNNVFGTLNVIKASDKYGVKRFIMISTDKAVNPTSVMGATKRICEMLIQTMNRQSNTEFVAVRFGNVLGSNGSVIPLFEKQIEEGGPVTVTSKEIIRYFMTIPEAVSLVLQAGAYAKGGEIFVFDMGDPVKIYDLAVKLIELSGYTLNENMDIKIIGLRPGEKLYEELLMKEEGLQKTDNKLIYIGKPIQISKEEIDAKLDLLKKSLLLSSAEEVKRVIGEVVSTYHEPK